jgi:capsular polysaccharide biosynthesis protein
LQEQELSLRDYVEVIKRRKKTILLVFFIAIIGSAVLSFVLPPVYQVESTMKIGNIIDVDTLEKELIEGPIAASQFLKGPQILIETIKELKLPYALEELREKILIEPVRETEDLVQIKVDVNDPGEAVNIANYLGTKLLDRHKEIKKLYEDKEEILARYDEQITDINKELDGINRSKEEILAGYDQQIIDINKELDGINRSKEAILAGYDENIQSINNQITSLKNEIDETKKEMTKLEVSLEVVSREIENKMKDSESLSEAEANMLVGRLDDMRSGWENYRSNVIERQRQYDSLLDRLREVQLEKTEFEQTKGQRYDTLSGDMRGIEQEKVKFKETKEQRYDTLIGQLRQAQLEKTRLERVDSVKMYNTEVLVAAEEPKIPIKPNKLLNILVAAVVSLIVGLGLAFSLEYFEKTD